MEMEGAEVTTAGLYTQDLSFGIIEVLQSIALHGLPHSDAQSLMCLKVYMTSLQNDTDKLNCKIKILSDCKVDVKQTLEDGLWSCLRRLLYEEGCENRMVVTTQGDDEWIEHQYTFTTQTGYSLCTGRLKQQKVKAQFKITFRVSQSEDHIIETGQKVHGYLHQLKLFHSQLDLLFQMHLRGLECRNDFSCDVDYSPLSLGLQPQIVVSPGFYSRRKDLGYSGIHVKKGETTVLPSPGHYFSSLPPLSVQATSAFIPYHFSNCLQSHGFVNIMFFYGNKPMILQNLDFGRLQSEFFFSCTCNTCINSDPFGCPIQEHVRYFSAVDDSFQETKSFMLFVFLSIQSNHSTSPVKQGHRGETELFYMIQSKLSEWIVVWRERLHDAIESAVSDVWRKQFKIQTPQVEGIESEEGNRTEAVPLATDSLLTILSSTTNDHFKKSCLQTLKVSNLSDAKEVLKNKLSEISSPYRLHSEMCNYHPQSEMEAEEDSQEWEQVLEDLDKWTEEE